MAKGQVRIGFDPSTPDGVFVEEPRGMGRIPERKTPRPHFSHSYYVKEGVTDVAKMRGDAARDAAGDKYCPEGECSIIHFHRLLEECKVTATGYDEDSHEEFHRGSCPDAKPST